MIFDGLIIRTTWGMRDCINRDKERKEEKHKEVLKARNAG